MERAAGVGVGGRTWFSEDDRPGRRLAVRARTSRGHVSLSFWDGGVCRATFRLPRSQIPRLVFELTAAPGATAGVEEHDETATLQLLTEIEECDE